MIPLRFAGTPTHNRPEMYSDLLKNITPQVDEFITVTHGPEAEKYATGVTIPYREKLPNLEVMWNNIIDKAHELANGKPYYVAILNDDALVADDWYDKMVQAIEAKGSAGASTPRARGKAKSIFGGAFVIKGDMGIRMAGDIRWWYTDDLIQKVCQQKGGFTIVNGVRAVNRLANQSTRDNDELKAINSEDWPKFKKLYGMPESPWENTEYHVVISAPSGKRPHHILDTIGDRSVTILTDGWETEQLAHAAKHYSRFLYIKESIRPLDGFWEEIDSEQGSCWLLARPSCYMGIYDAPTLKRMLQQLPPTRTKEDSISNEWLIHSKVNWKSIWPEVNDNNALRIEIIDGVEELVIGNMYIEKLKSTARCPQCTTGAGICHHLKEGLKVLKHGIS